MGEYKCFCRNCGSENISQIQKGATVAPFFAARVWGIRSLALNKRSRNLSFLNFISLGLAEHVAQKAKMCMDALLCNDCSFYSTWIEIPEESLSGLYRDYRSHDYNNDRELYEPGYTKSIGQLIGGTEESDSRNYALNNYITELEARTSFRKKDIRKALDWGGADGRFLPSFDLSCDRYVFEISNITPIQGVNRVEAMNNDMEFDYIQLAHVLEHMSNPLRFINEVVKHLGRGGYLYIEVPLEVDPHTFMEHTKSGNLLLEVHEHINKYTERSLASLVKAINLEVVDVSTYLVDMRWTKMNVIRLLAQKP